MNRRNFIRYSALGSAAMSIGTAGLANTGHHSGLNMADIKPIAGSWFEFQHLLPAEGEYWDPDLAKFTEAQWKEKVKEISELGFEYLVIQEVALDGKSIYPSKLVPQYKLGCADPLEAVLAAGDEVGMKFFLSNDFWDDCQKGEFLMTDPGIKKLRNGAMEEIVKKYGHHSSFYGWYFPNESYLMPYFDEKFIKYVNECSHVARSLQPASFNLIAPYNIKAEKSDDQFVKQLERMNIDVIAYQDGVGVNHTKLGEPAKHFENLYKAHQKAARSRIWADMEVFYFEKGTKDNLLPADFETRILQQMKDLSPFVDKILIYQYIGCFNKPGTTAYAGHRNQESVRLYNQYKSWLDKRNKSVTGV
ncbi:MAG: DUF4434 domain-containing protein [Chitinophagaceae bacterium]|nr:DUF4434 domain-containing protein [Chitinophagaceae bacterium]